MPVLKYCIFLLLQILCLHLFLNLRMITWKNSYTYVLKETPENKFTKVRNSQRFARSANRHANKIYQSLLFFQAFKNIELMSNQL